jgi:hypothetical protein
MGIGTSLVVIAIGAILRFAVYQHHAAGFNVGTVGAILMIVGIIGLVISIIILTIRRRTDVYHHDEIVDPVLPPRGYYR